VGHVPGQHDVAVSELRRARSGSRGYHRDQSGRNGWDAAQRLHGGFSFSGPDGLTTSGMLVSTTTSHGKVKAPACGDGKWWADKAHRNPDRKRPNLHVVVSECSFCFPEPAAAVYARIGSPQSLQSARRLRFEGTSQCLRNVLCASFCL
jgi:hypothetical protein